MTSTTSILEKLVPELGEDRVRRFNATENVCQVLLVNGCPPDWNVHIVAAGVDFFFRDGTSFQDGPVKMDLTSGQSFRFDSNDATKCVERELCVLTAVIPGNPPQNLSNQSDPIPANQCLESITVTLGPKQTALAHDGKQDASRELVLSLSR